MKDKEEADYIEWLKGKKNKVNDREVEESMVRKIAIKREKLFIFVECSVLIWFNLSF